MDTRAQKKQKRQRKRNKYCYGTVLSTCNSACVTWFISLGVPCLEWLTCDMTQWHVTHTHLMSAWRDLYLHVWHVSSIYVRLCLCVCVREREMTCLHLWHDCNRAVTWHTWMKNDTCVCVCVCVCERGRWLVHICHRTGTGESGRTVRWDMTHTHMCVCVCVCVRERERERVLTF